MLALGKLERDRPHGRAQVGELGLDLLDHTLDRLLLARDGHGLVALVDVTLREERVLAPLPEDVNAAPARALARHLDAHLLLCALARIGAVQNGRHARAEKSPQLGGDVRHAHRRLGRALAHNGEDLLLGGGDGGRGARKRDGDLRTRLGVVGRGRLCVELVVARDLDRGAGRVGD